MSPTLVGILGLLIMLAIFLTGRPVANVMILVGWIGFSSMISVKGGLNLLSRNIYETFSSYGLTTIPLFIIMGGTCFNSGIGKRLYATAYQFLGSTRGGLASGHGYRLYRLRGGTRVEPGNCCHHGHRGIAGNGKLHADADEAECRIGGLRRRNLGMIMPPSVVLIVYGILTEQSIVRCSVAGIIPAIVMTILFIITTLILLQAASRSGPPGCTSPGQSLTGMGDTVLVFILVMSGLFLDS